MPAITTVLKSDEFIVCHGFLGPNESHELILKGDGFFIEWLYCILTPLDNSNAAESTSGTIEFYDRFSDELLHSQTMKSNELMDYKPWIGTKLKQTVNDNFAYYFAFNPIPYTDKHDCYLYDYSKEGEIIFDSSDEIKYVIPIVGSCFVNGVNIKEKQFVKVLQNKPINIFKEKKSIICVFIKK